MNRKGSAVVHVAVVDDHQSVIDGYAYRLGQNIDTKLVGTARYGDAVWSILEKQRVDVLLLDISLPTAPDNPNPFPVLHAIPKLLQHYPHLYILVISMHTERALIRAVIDAGATGYILKDDGDTLENIATIVMGVAKGNLYLSRRAEQAIQETRQPPTKTELTARQSEILSLCLAYPNDTTAELADRLNISHSTVRNTLSNAYIRLEVRSLTAAIQRARELGIITPLPAPAAITPAL